MTRRTVFLFANMLAVGSAVVYGPWPVKLFAAAVLVAGVVVPLGKAALATWMAMGVD